MLILLALLPAMAADVDPFRPAGSLASGQGTLQGEAPFVLGSGFGFGLNASFAQDLAVRQRSNLPDESLVANALPLEFYGNYTLEDRGIRFEIFAPIYASLSSPGTNFNGPALGDLRLQANLHLLKISDSLSFGVVPRIELPTGNRNAQTRRGLQVGVTGTAGGDLPYDLGWIGNAGVTFAGPDEFFGVGMGTSIDLVAGGFWRASEGTRIGIEVDSQVGLVKRAGGSNTTSAWHVFAQNRLESGLGLTVGAGSGLIAGVGAPDYRVFSALTYHVTVRDTDDDGIVDKLDTCPTEPEDLDGFEDEDGCPDVDNDNDTLVDSRDTCPNQPEDLDGFEDEDGCPDVDNDHDGVLDTDDLCPLLPGEEALQGCPDRDADGISDAEDACPDEPGSEALQGCPDRDLDRVPDHRDACPDEPIPPSIDPATSDGCPQLAYLTDGRITIFEKVNFQTGKASVADSSFELLDAVAKIFNDNPQVKKVEIAGHTDNVGSEGFNQRLSKRRATAVVDYLKAHGVDPGRIQAAGYGEATPLTTNRTESGRAKNRRVEFVILEQEVSAIELRPVPPAADLKNVWDVPPGASESPVAPAPAPINPASVWDRPAPIASQPAPVAPQPAPVAPKPAPTRLWDAPAQEAVPTPETAPAPEAALAPAPEAAPAPAPEAVPESIARPTSAVIEVADTPTYPSTTDKMGMPAKLSIILTNGLSKATVYIDNEPLPRPAPLRRFPILAGEHKIWIQDDATGLDHEENLTFHNGQEITMVLPLGASVEQATPEPSLPAPPPRKGRRSRKR